MTDRAAQKPPWSACWETMWIFLTHFVATRSRTFSTSTKPQKLCFFFLAFCSKLSGAHFLKVFILEKNGKRGVYSVPVLQVCDGLCLNDLDTWILMDFGYLILDFLDFRCKKNKKIKLDKIRFAHFSDHYKTASPIKLLQNEGARPRSLKLGHIFHCV